MTPELDTADRRLHLLQVWSGVLFALFLTVHLTNLAVATLGAARYDEVQTGLRRAYQSPVLELVLVLGPLLVHAAAGALRLLRRVRAAPVAAPSWRTRLHRWSGAVLLVFFLGHVTATRGASALYGVFPRFEGVAFTLRWVPAYFWPYYTLFALAGLVHLVLGLPVALSLLGLRASALRKPAVAGTLIAFGALLLVLGLLSIGGVFFDVGHPERGPYAQLLVKLGVAHLEPAGPAPRRAPSTPTAASGEEAPR